MGQSVQQSGTITPGNLVVWVTDGVVGDGGPAPDSTTVLATLLSANFNSILDQTIQLPNTITAFQLTGILITNASLSLTTATGGFYPTTAKGGTALVAAGQSYASLTTSTKLLSATLAAGITTTRYSSANMDVINGYLTMYLSLSVAQGLAATADVYVLGNNLSV